jgi:hypothetical protein
MRNDFGQVILFLITPAWRNFLVGCYSEAEYRFWPDEKHLFPVAAPQALRDSLPHYTFSGR